MSSLRKPSRGGGCLEIRGGGVPPGSPHPDPISNQQVLIIFDPLF